MTRQSTDGGCAGCVVTLVILIGVVVLLGAAFGFGQSLIQ